MKVEVKKSASKSLAKIPIKERKKIISLLLDIEKLKTISEIPNNGKLKGYPNRFKIREGNYRIIYKTESDSHILITAIAHRKEVYERLFGIAFSI